MQDFVSNEEIIQEMREVATKTDSREVLLAASTALMMVGEEVDRKRVFEEVQKSLAEDGADMAAVSICLRLLNKDDKTEVEPREEGQEKLSYTE